MTNEELIVDLQWKLQAITIRAEHAEQEFIEAKRRIEDMRQAMCAAIANTNKGLRIAAGEKE